jgi:hypothetical protein
MKILLKILIILSIASCSHEFKRSTVTITPTNLGIVKNPAISIPLYFTLDANDANAPTDSLKIHLGHFLKAHLTKDQNLEILKNLEEKNFHLINLSLEDIAIAETQNINFSNYKKLIFLNSSVSDLNKDDLYTDTNVVPYYAFEDAVLIGLSDYVVDKKVQSSRFIFNDYVYSILRIKKLTKAKNYKSYIIIHHIGDKINEVMERLPPTFINSLAN